MAGRQRHVERVVQQVPAGQAVRHGERVLGPVLHHGDVQIAAHQCRYRLVRLAFGQRHGQLRVPGPQVHEYPGQQPARRGGEGCHGQLPGDRAPVLGEAGLHLFHPGEQFRRVAGQQLAGLGQPDAPALPLDQPLPDLPLQPGNLLRDGRCGDVQGTRRADDRPGRPHRVQHPQPLQVQHRSDATRPGRERLACPYQ
jgi:hypothetical protein